MKKKIHLNLIIPNYFTFKQNTNLLVDHSRSISKKLNSNVLYEWSNEAHAASKLR